MMKRVRTTIKKDDYIGQKFNRLTILSFAPTRKNGSYVNCLCECGTQKQIRLIHVSQGATVSCGCAALEAVTKHGMSQASENGLWRVMRQRCNDKNCKEYPYYGGRGIKVSEAWNDFATFYADMGPRPEGMTIDRVNNDGDYCKENCRWASRTEQARNRRNTVFAEINGALKPIAEWCEIYGISRNTVYERLKRDWTAFLAITTPTVLKPTLE